MINIPRNTIDFSASNDEVNLAVEDTSQFCLSKAYEHKPTTIAVDVDGIRYIPLQPFVNKKYSSVGSYLLSQYLNSVWYHSTYPSTNYELVSQVMRKNINILRWFASRGSIMFKKSGVYTGPLGRDSKPQDSSISALFATGHTLSREDDYRQELDIIIRTMEVTSVRSYHMRKRAEQSGLRPIEYVEKIGDSQFSSDIFLLPWIPEPFYISEIEGII